MARAESIPWWRSPVAHRLILFAVLPAVFLMTLWVARPADNFEHSSQPTDGELFAKIVRDVRAGQPYYQAFGAEVRALKRPAGSIFNWRQPLLYEVLGFGPFFIARTLLLGLAALLVLQTGFLHRFEPLSVLLMVNAVAVAIAGGVGDMETTYFAELWAGLCIALSAVAYARGRDTAGIGWGLLALFLRELSGLYCVLAMVIAVHRRRWREVAVWSVGLTLYAAYFAFHAWQVGHQILPSDYTHSRSWLYWGGFPFLVRTLQVNGMLIVAPKAILALFVTLLMSAWWSPRMPLHIRATVAGYATCFMAVGLPFNQYWGLMIAPTVALWLAYTPNALDVLWANSRVLQRTPLSSAAA